MKCLPYAHKFEHFSLVGDTVYKGYRIHSKWSLAEGVTSLEMGFEGSLPKNISCSLCVP